MTAGDEVHHDLLKDSGHIWRSLTQPRSHAKGGIPTFYFTRKCGGRGPWFTLERVTAQKTATKPGAKARSQSSL